jgi:hypothetical protein
LSVLAVPHRVRQQGQGQGRPTIDHLERSGAQGGVKRVVAIICPWQAIDPCTGPIAGDAA